MSEKYHVGPDYDVNQQATPRPCGPRPPIESERFLISTFNQQRANVPPPRPVNMNTRPPTTTRRGR